MTVGFSDLKVWRLLETLTGAAEWNGDCDTVWNRFKRKKELN